MVFQESRLWVIFRELLGRVPWEAAMKGKDAQESWLIFKENFLRAQEQTILLDRKTGNSGRKPVWLSQEFLNELKHTKKKKKLSAHEVGTKKGNEISV